ncbi:thyroid adenoma-associated protein homolog [Pollicipes pollicipes]|uniref:thyroid adenoma-associated protein homolog n=1 Tax=Pollicipes pollicipes TaxID=41117 RepID=UPI00188490E4|nr:thyroid adenoma-associated protein homolog [Pollicipes pollicipes]
MALLAETRHRGAFEQAHVGFSRVCHTLWKSPLPELNQTPGRWLDEVVADIRGEGRQTLCSTRRSAGLPFLMQALLTSEPSVIGSAYFSRSMSSLLEVATQGGETSVHAMNVLRALFRDARLGESVGAHVTDGIMAAVTAFKADTCAERNSASLLFAALVTRVFGVQRSRDTLAKKNCMTGRLFFLRYPALYPFLCAELAASRDPFPVLLLLARLYPSPVEGSDSQYPLRAFLPALRAAAASMVLQARLLAARAICSLLPYSSYPEATLALLDEIERDGLRNQNLLHGRLLQVLYMLRHCVVETSAYTPPDLLRWRPVADRCLLLGALLSPPNRCPLTQAAACDELGAVLDAWSRLVEHACRVDGRLCLRRAALPQEVSMWKSLLTLLADDEAEIRDSAAEVVDVLDPLDELFPTDDRDLRVTIRALLEWTFAEDDGGQIGRLQDADRVFDKGEMNIHSEDVALVRAATDALLTVLPELPEQPLLFPVHELAPLALVRHLPADYQLELSDILREAARQALAELRALSLGAAGVAQRGHAHLCLRAFRRLKLAAVLREFFLEPAVDALWTASVALLAREPCFPGLWEEVVNS